MIRQKKLNLNQLHFNDWALKNIILKEQRKREREIETNIG